jgi:hypothetical protein
MDPRVQIAVPGLEKKFQLEMRLAALLSQTSTALVQAGSIREPLQKLSQQATGTARNSVQAFQVNLAAVLGAPAGPPAPAAGSPAPPADQITLARVNGQVAVLYGQVWQVDAEPTATQSEAFATTEHDALDAMKRWNMLKASDLPALNAELRAANLPEVQIESDPHQDDAGLDEE